MRVYSGWPNASIIYGLCSNWCSVLIKDWCVFSKSKDVFAGHIMLVKQSSVCISLGTYYSALP